MSSIRFILAKKGAAVGLKPRDKVREEGLVSASFNRHVYTTKHLEWFKSSD